MSAGFSTGGGGWFVAESLSLSLWPINHCSDKREKISGKEKMALNSITQTKKMPWTPVSKLSEEGGGGGATISICICNADGYIFFFTFVP